MEKEEKEERSEAEIRETGSVSLDENRKNHRIKLLTIIGEIEGHEAVSGNTKATKYEHLLPMLAEIEDSEEVDGLLILLNSLRNMIRTQDRITRFLAEHSHISKERIEELMLNPTELVKDVGTLLEGREAVEEGLIDAVGGMKDALGKLHAMIEEEEKKKGKIM